MGKTINCIKLTSKNRKVFERNYNVNEVLDFDKSSICAISFFSGAGGLDIGTQLGGAKVISSLDFDKDSVESMKLNKYFNHTEHRHNDVRDIRGIDYKNLLKSSNPEKLILTGGPPCQPFSKAGYWVTNENRLGGQDPRNMIGEYLRLIGELKPNGFLLENVESILHPKNSATITEIQEFAYKLGYDLLIYRANSADFGVPQKRKRVFFIGSKKIIGEPIKTHFNNLKNIDDNLLPYERVIDWIGKFGDEKYFEPEETVHGKTYEKELSMIPPGQNYFALTERSGMDNPIFKANTRFWSFLLKLDPNLPSWTIAAQPGPWVGPFHWENRRLRVPEIAAIQTFPDDYLFKGTRRSIQKQIGNAVPPLLGKAMTEFLISSL